MLYTEHGAVALMAMIRQWPRREYNPWLASDHVMTRLPSDATAD